MTDTRHILHSPRSLVTKRQRQIWDRQFRLKLLIAAFQDYRDTPYDLLRLQVTSNRHIYIAIPKRIRDSLNEQ